MNELIWRDYCPAVLSELLLSESPGFVLEIAAESVAEVIDALRASETPVVAFGRVTESPRLTLLAAGTVWCDPDLAEIHRLWVERMRLITHNASAGRSAGREV